MRDMSFITPKSEKYCEAIKAKLSTLKPNEIAKHVSTLSEKNETWRRTQTINLGASENVMSYGARKLLDSDLALRVAEGWPGDKAEPGEKYHEEIEAIVMELSKKLFGSKYVEWRSTSGTMSNGFTFFGLTKPGDTIMSQSLSGGGNVSYRQMGIAGLAGLVVESIPSTDEDFGVDLKALREVAEKIKPKLIVVGGSVILFPYPVSEIRKIADDIGALVVYDGAHVGPLISSKVLQDPLREGAHVLQVNTHKMMAGPIGGLVFTDEYNLAKKISKVAWPGMLATRDVNKYAALAVTLAEMLEFGEDYARQIVKNAQALAHALVDEGFDVWAEHKGYTKTHQVIPDVRKNGGGENVELSLENTNIIGTKMQLPFDPEVYHPDPSGLRLGVQEVTRQGMKERDMKRIAEFVRMILINKKKSSEIIPEIEEFLGGFPKIEYSFDV